MFIGTAQVVRHAKEGINPQRLIPNLVRAKSGMALYLYILCMYKINLFVHVPCLIVALVFFLNLQVTKRTESHQFNKFKYSQCFSTLVLGLIMHQQKPLQVPDGKRFGLRNNLFDGRWKWCSRMSMAGSTGLWSKVPYIRPEILSMHGMDCTGSKINSCLITKEGWYSP